MTFSIWGFLGRWLAYGLASVVIFTITSGGWTGVLLILPASAIFYGSVLVLGAIISAVLYSQGSRELSISKKTISFILVLQVLAALFNYGDCGDAPGGSAFLFRILLPNDAVCQSDVFIASDIFIWLSSALLGLLALSSLLIVGAMYWKARPRKIFSTVLLVFIYLFVSVSIAVAAVWVFTAGFRAEQSRLNDPNTICVGDCGPEWEGRTYEATQNPDGTWTHTPVR